MNSFKVKVKYNFEVDKLCQIKYINKVHLSTCLMFIFIPLSIRSYDFKYSSKAVLQLQANDIVDLYLTFFQVYSKYKTKIYSTIKSNE